jgi:hypothetical protein
MPGIPTPFDSLTIHRGNQFADFPPPEGRLHLGRTYVCVLASRVFVSVRPPLPMYRLLAHTDKYPLEYGIELYDPAQGPPSQ